MGCGWCKSASCGSLCFICLTPEAEGARRPGLSIIGVLRKPLVGGGDQSDRSDRSDLSDLSDGEDGEDAGGRDAAVGDSLGRGCFALRGGSRNGWMCV